jgi:hypothetical protein
MPGPGGLAERGRQQFKGSMMMGGSVKATGMYMLHKGEVVVPAMVVKRSAKKPTGKDMKGK